VTLSEYDSDQENILPDSQLGLWFDSDGWIWIDTQDGTTHPFRTLHQSESEEWKSLAEAQSEAKSGRLRPLGYADGR